MVCFFEIIRIKIKYQFKECVDKGGLDKPKSCLKYDCSLNSYYLMLHYEGYLFSG